MLLTIGINAFWNRNKSLIVDVQDLVPSNSVAHALKSGPACKLALNQVKQHLVMSLITRSGQSSCGQVRQSIDGLFESYILLQNVKIQFKIQIFSITLVSPLIQ